MRYSSLQMRKTRHGRIKYFPEDQIAKNWFTLSVPRIWSLIYPNMGKYDIGLNCYKQIGTGKLCLIQVKVENKYFRSASWMVLGEWINYSVFQEPRLRANPPSLKSWRLPSGFQDKRFQVIWLPRWLQQSWSNRKKNSIEDNTNNV